MGPGGAGAGVSLSLTGRSFRHGVHPHEHKESTEHGAIERMPFVASYVLPLGQHGGKPARAVVHKGEAVERGQLVAAADGFVSTCLHSPVTGRVIDIGHRRHPGGQLVPALEIEADPFSSQVVVPAAAPADPRTMEPEAFADHVQRGGIVGLGGAAFPAHVKYVLPKGKRVYKLVLNGCECEPYLTCDHRMMVENAERIVRGIRILADRLGVEESVVGVEANKPDAVERLRAAVPEGVPIRVVPLHVKYPQGAEKMLIKALFGREVPAGKLPLDVGVIVNNVGTMAALADWFDRGHALIERVVTVSGPGVVRPCNLLVPVGTPVRALLAHAGGTLPETRELVMGGPMMGTPLGSLDVPVLKGTSGVLAFTETEAARPNEYSCLKCGRCLDACANFLNPSKLARLARAGRFGEMEPLFVMDCMECGACSFACPSNIPIVQLIRVAKSALREDQRREKGS